MWFSFFYRGDYPPLFLGLGDYPPCNSNKLTMTKELTKKPRVVVSISDRTHSKLKRYTKKHGLKLGTAADNIIKKYLCEMKKSGT